MASTQQQYGLPLDEGVAREDAQLLQRLIRIAKQLQGSGLEGLGEILGDLGRTASTGQPSLQSAAVSFPRSAGPQGPIFEDTDVPRMDDDPDYEDDIAGDSDSSDAYDLDEDESTAQTAADRTNSERSAATSKRQTRSTTASVRPHATVEQRYRSLLNSKIHQLHTSIPLLLNDVGEGNKVDERDQKTKAVVLDRTTKYINQLLAQYNDHENEETELRRGLQRWLDIE